MEGTLQARVCCLLDSIVERRYLPDRLDQIMRPSVWLKKSSRAAINSSMADKLDFINSEVEGR